ncbi:hypothetical protein JK621_13035 [Serratia plymuthica]|uniref:hypothetical protein n=1 Tax=Serratia plymuthica TaxID=82996 RepID=UPI001BAFB1D8|nr:hypothetical protein [Serratia plymuthica]QUY46392.1 hypothetical protein JK621_13035 [Serratia plymuthica]
MAGFFVYGLSIHLSYRPVGCRSPARAENRHAKRRTALPAGVERADMEDDAISGEAASQAV